MAARYLRLDAMTPATLPHARPSAGDLVAGLSVALILIPQALAYAELAGMPAHHGLYAAALPTIAAALFASSRYLQTGPGAMTGLLILGALMPLAARGGAEYVALAALLALVVGTVRVLIGLLKGGWVAYLMSQPVLMGFMTAAGILIIASQLPTALGVDMEPQSILVRAVTALGAPGEWEGASIAMAVGTIVLSVGARYVHKLFPGVLLAVVVGIIYSRVAGYDGATVGTVPSALPHLSLAMPWHHLPELLLPGTVIALVGFAEVAAISRSFAMQDREEWNPDREFVGQGAANLVAGLAGGFPVGGSFVRSSVARMTGGRSRWAGAVTGLTVLAFLPFAAIISPLPRAVLAGIVIGAVAHLVRLRALARLVRYSWFQGGIAWVTFASTLALAPRVDRAVLIGVGLSVMIHLFRESRIRVSARFGDETMRLTPRGVLYFGSAPGLDLTVMQELAAHPDAEAVVIDLANLGRIDYTGAQALKQIVEDAERAGLDVHFEHIPPQAQGILRRVFGTESGLVPPKS